SATVESWMHIELAAPVTEELLDRIERDISLLLAGLRAVDEDTHAMTAALIDTAQRLERTSGGGDDIDSTDYADLLRWLADGHFTVLGCVGRTLPPASAAAESDAA